MNPLENDLGFDAHRVQAKGLAAQLELVFVVHAFSFWETA